MKYPYIFMKITMKFPRDCYENRNEKLRDNYDNRNEILLMVNYENRNEIFKGL